LHLPGRDVTDQLRQGEGIAGPFEALGCHACNMARDLFGFTCRQRSADSKLTHYRKTRRVVQLTSSRYIPQMFHVEQRSPSGRT
jgi:hypothetical protein